MMRVLAAPRALTLRNGTMVGNGHRWYLGTREVCENAQLLVQMTHRTEYATGPGYGRYVCTDVDWLTVRVSYRDLKTAPEQPREAATAGGRLLCLKLPFRCGGAVLVPAHKSMQFAWPGPTATRAAS